MKQVSGQLSQHLSQSVSTLARLLKITRVDGDVIRLTDHDADFFYADGSGLVTAGPVATLGGTLTAEDTWGSTMYVTVPAASVINPAAQWTITVGITTLEGLGDSVAAANFCVKRTLPGSLTVIDSTPITFSGTASPTFPAVGLYVSDPIDLATDTNHDYWFMWYTAFVSGNDATWNCYLQGSSPIGGGTWADNIDYTQSANIPPSGTPLGRHNVIWLMAWDELTAGGGNYVSDDGLTFSALEFKSDGSPDTCEVTGFLDDDVISEGAIRARLYDQAVFELRVVNWSDLTQGDLKLFSGTIGDIKMEAGKFTIQLRGLTQALTTIIGSVYGSTCRATLFSNSDMVIDPTNHWKCGLNRLDWFQTGTVASSPDSLTILPVISTSPPSPPFNMRGSATPTLPAPFSWFADGLIQFTSGNLSGYSYEIQSYDDSTCTISLFPGAPMSEQPDIGSTFEIEPGCNKTKDHCLNRFSNLPQFRGEAEIPGLNVLASQSQTQVSAT
jgi:hypothetical protein